MGKFNINEYVANKAASFNSATDFAQWAIKNGVINLNKAQYQAVREYYHALPYSDRRRAKIDTAEHFSLSYDRVEDILYRKHL